MSDHATDGPFWPRDVKLIQRWMAFDPDVDLVALAAEMRRWADYLDEMTANGGGFPVLDASADRGGV